MRPGAAQSLTDFNPVLLFMRVIPIIVAAIILLTLPLIWLLVREMGGPDTDFVNETGPSVDSGARIEIEMLRQQIEAMQQRIDGLEGAVQGLRNDLSRPRTAEPLDGAKRPSGPNAIIDAYAQVVQIADRRNVNNGITVAGPDFLERFLGRPREDLSDKCQPMTNPDLREFLVEATVGPIKVRMLKPAVESLRRVFENVRQTDRDLYDRINTAGSLCIRQIRGTNGRTSTHSFGLAVDLNIDGHLDTLGDGRTQLGLTILADFFNEEGWVWGAGFSREDSMHFEVSQKQLEEWRRQGRL